MLVSWNKSLDQVSLGLDLELVADPSCIKLLLQKIKDHLLGLLLHLIDINMINFLPKVVLKVFLADRLYKILMGNNHVQNLRMQMTSPFTVLCCFAHVVAV